jgi:hypothetical protein
MTKMINIYEEYTDLSDLYKEAHGVRPRHYKALWTEEELEAEYKHLSAIAEENFKEEEKREAQALVEFEKLLQDTIDLGAGDRETAMRWLIEGSGEYDLGYFFWEHGLSYEIQLDWAKKYKKYVKVQ